jgi:hypothetical protein
MIFIPPLARISQTARNFAGKPLANTVLPEKLHGKGGGFSNCLSAIAGTGKPRSSLKGLYM